MPNREQPRREREIAADRYDDRPPQRRRIDANNNNNNDDHRLVVRQGIHAAEEPLVVEDIQPANPNLEGHDFPRNRTLALPSDIDNLNILHRKIRSSYLEIFQVTEDEHDPKYRGKDAYRGRIGLRCKFCIDAEMENVLNRSACFFPRNLKSLCHSVYAWERVHFARCPFVTNEIKTEYHRLKELTVNDRDRKTEYWESSALRIGLVNAPVGNGIVYKAE